MSEFRFVSDLDIETSDGLFVEETKESLKSKEVKAKEEIYELTGKLNLIKQQLEDIQKKLVKLETPHEDIVLGKPTITKENLKLLSL